MRWPDYEYQPSFLLGFHGCDRAVGERVLANANDDLTWSKNDHDWLGHGVYFWEGDPARAMRWAEDLQLRERIKEPFVLGAILDLRRCLDLLSEPGLRQVQDAHDLLKMLRDTTSAPMPQNTGRTADLLRRNLDCAVIEELHRYRKEMSLEPYDSVRAPFLEGGELYPTAGFRSQNHIQICVRDVACIKGYFRPKTR